MLLIALIAGILILALGLSVVAVSLRSIQSVLERHTSALEKSLQLHTTALDVAREANDLSSEAFRFNRDLLEKQLRQSSLPHITCNVHPAGSELDLVISNPGAVPAYGLSIIALAEYASDELDPRYFAETFLVRTVAGRWRQKLETQPTAFSMLYQREYAHFPARTGMVYRMRLPLLPRQCLIALQYGAATGEHFVILRLFRAASEPDDRHLQPYHIIQETPVDERIAPPFRVVEIDGSFRVTSVRPHGWERADGQLELVEAETGRRVDADAFPQVMDSGVFRTSLASALPARLLAREYGTSADREIWQEASVLTSTPDESRALSEHQQIQ